MNFNLDDVRDIAEHPDFFVVHHTKRGPFRLPKDKLPEDVQASIRSIAAGKAAAVKALGNEAGPDGVVRAAEGDVVEDPSTPEARLAALQGLASGVPALPPALAELIDPNRPQPPAAMQVATTPLTDIALGTTDVLGAIRGAVMKDPTPVPEERPFRDTLYDAGLLVRPGDGYTPPPAAPYTGTGEELQSQPQADAGPTYDALGALQSTPAVQPEQPVAPAPGRGPVAAAPRAGGPRGEGVPEIPPLDTTELDAATAQRRAAVEEQGRIASQLAQEEFRIQAEANAAFTELAKAHDAKVAANEAALKRARDDIASKPITRASPSFLGGIAMALGAFGSALARTPNFALEIINKRIDDDLSVQKANRAGMDKVVEQLLAEGMGIENAFRVAKADRQAQAAGLMLAAAKQAGSPQALATAHEASAKLMQDAFGLVRQARFDDLKLKTAPIAFRTETQSEVLRQALLRAQIRHIALENAQLPGKNAADARRQAVKDRTAELDLNEKERKGRVRVPRFVPGEASEPVFAGISDRRLVDPGDSETPKELLRLTNGMETLRRADEFFRPGFRAGPSSNQEFEVIKNQLLTLVKKPGDNSNQDIDRLAESLPSASTWSQVTGRPLVAIRALQRELASQVGDIERLRLVPEGE